MRELMLLLSHLADLADLADLAGGEPPPVDLRLLRLDKAIQTGRSAARTSWSPKQNQLKGN